jgi:hypothetical protein
LHPALISVKTISSGDNCIRKSGSRTRLKL